MASTRTKSIERSRWIGHWLAVPILVMCNVCLGAELSESVSLDAFLELYAKQESKDIIFDPRLRGSVRLQSGMTPGWITADEFYSVLLANNCSAYEADGVINVIMLTMAKQHKIPFYDGQYRDDLVQNQVVSSIIEVRNRPAMELVPILRPLVEQWGHIAADESSNSLAIVTTVGNVERLVEMVGKLDIKFEFVTDE